MNWFLLNKENFTYFLKSNLDFNFIDLYIFGSALNKTNPNDIDIMIALKEAIHIDEKNKIRDQIKLLKKNQYDNRDLHLLILTHEEFTNPQNSSSILNNIINTSVKIN